MRLNGQVRNSESCVVCQSEFVQKQVATEERSENLEPTGTLSVDIKF